jgi:two-component system, chemotaxis family, protein-glutamate methylesterase/glutaminase
MMLHSSAKTIINPEQIVRDVIVIGGSAGSYPAIATILAALPVDLRAFLGVVIHRGAHSYGDWSISFGRYAALRVQEGVEGALLEPGNAYIAPRDHHMRFEGGRVSIDLGAKQHHTRPAVDPLFVSAALEYGPRVVGIILSGSGRDGMHGLLCVSNSQGIGLVQRPAEAEHASMPQYAIAHDHVQAALRVDDMAEVLVRLVSGEKLSLENAEPSTWCSQKFASNSTS